MRKEEREKKDIEIERKEWARCWVCEEEYTKDIRINPPCLHSYCYQCVLASSSTSKLCPICHEPLPDDLSTLPPNIVLLHWLSLSPSPLPSLINQSALLDEGKQCEECEENKREVYCKERKQYYCRECFRVIHSLKKRKDHRISEAALASPSPFKTIIEYPPCDIHHSKKREIYCESCDELLCVYCIDDHSSHKIMTVEKYIRQVKDRWKREYEEEHKHCIDVYDIAGEERECITRLSEVEDEIGKLEDEIRQLEELLSTKMNEAKEYRGRLENIRSLRTRHVIAHRFVSFFLSSLPSLPLSSFYPLPSHPNYNNNVGKRIKDFFTKREIQQIYFHNEEELNNREEERRRRQEEEEERNRRMGQMMKANELIEGENYISSFGSRDNGPLQFKSPYYLSINSSLNLIAISECGIHRVQIVHINPSLPSSSSPYRTKFNVRSPRGIVFIASLGVLAVASWDDNQIHIYGVDDLLLPTPSPHLLPRYSIPPSPSSSTFHFQYPQGIAYSEEMKLLAVSDGHQIQLIGRVGKGEGGGKEVALHSSLSLSFNSDHIAFTSPLLSSPSLLLISNVEGGKVEAFAPSHPTVSCEWVKVREFGRMECPRGVAFLPSPSPCVVVCDDGNKKKGIERGIKVFSFSSSALLCSFNPSSEYFQSACGISVDYPFIAVSDIDKHKITLMRGGDIPQ